MLRFAVLALLVAVSVAKPHVPSPSNDLWLNFKILHGKVYNAEEEVLRKAIFAENLQGIAQHNLEADLSLHSFTLGVNKFADLTTEEFAAQVNGYRGVRKPAGRAVYNATNDDLPATVDWRTSNLVTPVKNQGQCGSCWAFSAVASLEGQHAKATKELVSLSEQNLVDCSAAEGNEGCNGGLMDFAFQYIEDAGGIDTEESYPYEGVDGKCRYDAKKSGATVKSFVDIKVGSEADLQNAVANVGPISVAIDASSFWFQFYFGGVYDHNDCGNAEENLDHGVTAVGYGTDGGQDYWLIKNSWGNGWGESGYLKLARNKDNLCGVATAASYPTV